MKEVFNCFVDFKKGYDWLRVIATCKVLLSAALTENQTSQAYSVIGKDCEYQHTGISLQYVHLHLNVSEQLRKIANVDRQHFTFRRIGRVTNYTGAGQHACKEM